MENHGGRLKDTHLVMEVSTCAGLMVYAFTPSVFSAAHHLLLSVTP